MTDARTAAGLTRYIRDIPDFPKPGIVFKDITPLLGDPHALRGAVDAIAAPFADAGITKVLGTEARGFILAAPVAYQLSAGFVPVRKAGKLPWEIERQEYDLEYGTDLLEVHRDSVEPGDRVLVVDDILATGGTAAATALLAARLGVDVMGFGFLIELGFLGGRSLLGDRPINSVITYD